jgi:hypothetical protein
MNFIIKNSPMKAFCFDMHDHSGVFQLAADKCVCLLYRDRPQAGSPAIGTNSMGLLKTLRDQAEPAFRQR